MTDEQVIEKLIGILQPIYQEGRLTEDEVNEIFYYATIGNSMVEHGYVFRSVEQPKTIRNIQT